MGKKKEKRISIGEEDESVTKSKKTQNTNEHCLILTLSDRKRIIANFEPTHPLKQGEIKNYIRLNYDGHKFSPAFLYQNKSRSITKYLQVYNNKIKLAKANLQLQIKPAQPREKKNKQGYCAVCKKNYCEYVDHVKCKQHIDKMKQSQFTRYLRKIQKFYTDKKQRRAKVK